MQKKIAFVAFALLLNLFSSFTCQAEKIFVGVSQDEPIVFRDTDGSIKGISIDILEYVAQKEGWEVVYQYDTWAHNLKKLDEGGLDILPGMAYSEEREEQYEFNRENIVSNWGQIYLCEGSPVRRFLELDGKKIAVMKKDIYYEFFRSIIYKLDIYPIFAEVESYEAVINVLKQRKADAGILPHLYGLHFAKGSAIFESSLSFRPTQIRYATKKGDHRALLQTIDQHLEILKQNKNSVFYRSINVWVEGVNKLTFPSWLRPIWALVVVGLIFVLFLVGNVILRHQVRIRTDALKKTIAAKERIDSELRIATDIQLGLLPAHFPAFQDRPELDIYAQLEPAKEIGGDFYDFFFIDAERLCLVIGDVSGKGVPAALFMSMAKTIIKSTAKMIESPNEILAAVNREISPDNDSCTFVTVFLCVLNIKTGELCYSNAGHNPPILVRPNCLPQLIKGGESPAIGFDETVTFTEATLDIQPQDTLCLYTDGITEALNKNNEMFTTEKLLQEFPELDNRNARSLVSGILEKVTEFSVDTMQADDITILVLKYVP